MRQNCYRCRRPLSACYCKYIKAVPSGIKFVFLMHPKEAKRQRTGTGRLAHLSLPESEILTGIDFSLDERLNALLSSPEYAPVLLYPQSGAYTAYSPELKVALSTKKLIVIIIDSTWFCSKKMLRLSTNLHTLPCISFAGQYKSIFTFKKEPEEYCVSTIESCYYLIKELQEATLLDSSIYAEPLMDVFKKMIAFQLTKENERITLGLPGSHAYDWKYQTVRTIPSY